MILGFSTKINGKPTYFVEKIVAGLLEKNLITHHEAQKLLNIPFPQTILVNPKLHTIREDKNDRWKEGTKIDFFINCRQKNMFRFAPVLPVVSVQAIEIHYEFNNKNYKEIYVSIDGVSRCAIQINDGKLISCSSGIMIQLAQNDGFDTIEDFFRYFDKDFTGKIIHWTDLKY